MTRFVTTCNVQDAAMPLCRGPLQVVACRPAQQLASEQTLLLSEVACFECNFSLQFTVEEKISVSVSHETQDMY